MAQSSSQRPRLIRIAGLGKVFPGRSRQTVALDDVSVELFEGESVGLVGESGSGKTTLARCVMGLESPSAGSIEICGIDATDRSNLDARERRELTRSIQMVFQDPYSSLNPAHTVGAALREALRHAGQESGDAAVSGLLSQVALPGHYAARKPSALSGGERQRVAIARALAVRPKILVLDEAVSALDVTVQAHILELLKVLKAEIGLSFLFISHDLAVMRQVADRLYLLRDGHVVESGGINGVLNSPQTPYARQLIHAVPRSDPSWLDASEPIATATAPIPH
jgi:peptide/nickel transport system ATP-binding protein